MEQTALEECTQDCHTSVNETHVQNNELNGAFPNPTATDTYIYMYLYIHMYMVHGVERELLTHMHMYIHASNG